MKARFDSKPLKIAATVKTRKGDIGYIVKADITRVRRNLGKVDVFFPEREARGFTFMRRSVFLASFIELEQELKPAMAK